jgi:hypothetical protein
VGQYERHKEIVTVMQSHVEYGKDSQDFSIEPTNVFLKLFLDNVPSKCCQDSNSVSSLVVQCTLYLIFKNSLLMCQGARMFVHISASNPDGLDQRRHDLSAFAFVEVDNFLTDNGDVYDECKVRNS